MTAGTAAADSGYQRLLLGAFAFFNALRVVSYLPTFWAIHASGDSSQHSLWTWLIWSGSNLFTGLWHLERHQRRLDCTAGVLMVNALMCALAFLMVATYRW